MSAYAGFFSRQTSPGLCPALRKDVAWPKVQTEWTGREEREWGPQRATAELGISLPPCRAGFCFSGRGSISQACVSYWTLASYGCFLPFFLLVLNPLGDETLIPNQLFTHTFSTLDNSRIEKQREEQPKRHEDLRLKSWVKKLLRSSWGFFITK